MGRNRGSGVTEDIGFDTENLLNFTSRPIHLTAACRTAERATA